MLLVEDDKDVREMLEGVLELVFTKVMTAEDGVRGMELLTSPGIDFLVCDLQMPKIKGVDLLQVARRDNPQLALLAMSGYLSPENEVLLRDLEVPFLAKPFRSSDLLEAIESLTLTLCLQNRK